MSIVTDEYDLHRFVDAQRLIYENALTMLRRGELCTRWMSLIFPRFVGCYQDDSGERFAIGSLDEARAFLAHPLLGNRLRESLDALQWLYDRSPADLLSEQDLKNLHSSLTLFAEASAESPLRAMLAIWFGCRAEELTMSRIDLVPQ
jgi:uncharacterized protein (DUF1810 family)